MDHQVLGGQAVERLAHRDRAAAVALGSVVDPQPLERHQHPAQDVAAQLPVGERRRGRRRRLLKRHVLQSSKRTCFGWDAFLSSYISTTKTQKNIAGSRGAEYDLP